MLRLLAWVHDALANPVAPQARAVDHAPDPAVVALVAELLEQDRLSAGDWAAVAARTLDALWPEPTTGGRRGVLEGAVRPWRIRRERTPLRHEGGRNRPMAWRGTTVVSWLGVGFRAAGRRAAREQQRGEVARWSALEDASAPGSAAGEHHSPAKRRHGGCLRSRPVGRGRGRRGRRPRRVDVGHPGAAAEHLGRRAAGAASFRTDLATLGGSGGRSPVADQLRHHEVMPEPDEPCRDRWIDDE